MLRSHRCGAISLWDVCDAAVFAGARLLQSNCNNDANDGEHENCRRGERARVEVTEGRSGAHGKIDPPKRCHCG